MELVNTTKAELSVLDSLAAQAQMFAVNARMNLLQLGRVLTEAKPLVEHGKWMEWVKTNTDMSARGAEQCMQAYAKFGLDPRIAELGTTKMLKLLPLTEEEQEDLFSNNDVPAMSTRQLDEAIRQQKEKLTREAQSALADAKEAAQKEVDRERKARIAAEQENLRLKAEVKEQAELLEEQQEDINRTQEELLNVRSTIARGDAERAPVDQLTSQAFASAVRAFIGTCARMPHMSASFACMEPDERQEYDELLRTVESWAAGSRKALDTITVEGTVIEHV